MDNLESFRSEEHEPDISENHTEKVSDVHRFVEYSKSPPTGPTNESRKEWEEGRRAERRPWLVGPDNERTGTMNLPPEK